MRPRVAALSGAAVIFGLNLYLIRQVCLLEFTGKTNSMHGFWIAIAKLADSHWWQPSWWPYWYGGMPFEYTYAPLVPALTAFIANIAGIPHGQAFHVVAALAFCTGPVAVYGLAWQWCGSLKTSFAAAILYSLTAPAELFAPDATFGWAHVADARRMYVTFTWDEAPHQLALALACCAAAMLLRRNMAATALLAGLAALANPFGLAAFALLALATCLITGEWGQALASGLLAYVIALPSLTPDVLLAIRTNAQAYSESAWTMGSWLALAVAGGGAGLLAMNTGTSRPEVRFAALCSWIPISMAILQQRWNLHFVPQAGRYKSEAEAGLALLAAFVLAGIARRAPKSFVAAATVAGIALAVHQTIEHRRFSKRELAGAPATQTIEYRVARWLDANRTGSLVMAPGSIAQWMNAFSRVRQFNGGSYPTAPDPEQQRVLHAQFDCPFEECVSELRRYGVDTLVVSGPKSREFWKPYRDASIFEGRLPLLWREDDVSIYEIPGAAPRSVSPYIPGPAPWIYRAMSLAAAGELIRRILMQAVRRRPSN